ncbi:MAG: hypothetical protein ACI33O_03505 [Bhargavaea sp.]
MKTINLQIAIHIVREAPKPLPLLKARVFSIDSAKVFSVDARDTISVGVFYTEL